MSGFSFAECRVKLSQALQMTQTGSDWAPHNKQWPLSKHSSTQYSPMPQCLVFKGSSKFTDTDGSTCQANTGHEKWRRTRMILTFLPKTWRDTVNQREYFVWWRSSPDHVFLLGFEMSELFNWSNSWILLDISNLLSTVGPKPWAPTTLTLLSYGQ